MKKLPKQPWESGSHLKDKMRSFQKTLAAATLFFFILFSGCSRKKTVIPEDVLPRDRMIPILVDVHMAQAATGLYGAGDTSRYSMNDYLPYILKLHHVDRAVYDSSMAFYMLHPEIMQEMYDEVINELSRKQGEVSGK